NPLPQIVRRLTRVSRRRFQNSLESPPHIAADEDREELIPEVVIPILGDILGVNPGPPPREPHSVIHSATVSQSGAWPLCLPCVRAANLVNWKMAQTVRSATSTPDAGQGTYSFRGRIRTLDHGRSKGWSPSASIQVT